MAHQDQEPSSSPPPSESTHWSNITASTANPDKARVFVQLGSEGTKFYVPVAQSSSVNDLHEIALRRAIKFGFHADLTETFLRTTGSSVVALSGEDDLLDVLDLTEDFTFELCSLPESSTRSGLEQTSSNVSSTLLSSNLGLNDNADVYVRWVTLEDAVSHVRLSAIPIDAHPIPCKTPLNQVHNIALARYTASASSSKALPEKINLYLKDCRLTAKDNATTLLDLGLVGTKVAPLDIFVDIDTSDGFTNLASLNEDTDLEKLWGFSTTKRGISTLVTSLQVLKKGTASGTLRPLLEVLFELTHFTPVLIAIGHLQDSNLDDPACSSSLRVVASVLQILCLQIAPRWACASPELALEASRQVIAWLASLQSANTFGGNKSQQLLSRVEIKEAKDVMPVMSALLPYKFNVQIAISDIAPSAPQEKMLVVALDRDDVSLAHFVGRAVHSGYSPRWDFRLNLTRDWNILLRHKKVPTMQPTEFDLLLKTTALSKFRMVGPPQLGALLSTELPVITLSSAGYVSTYDQEDYACSEKRFFTYNVLQKKEVMKHGNPGPYLMQKLEAIISGMKKDRTFELDAWSYWNQSADFGTPDEAVIICMDTSGSMASVMPTGWVALPAASDSRLPSRLTEMKEFFKNLALRISALRLNTYLGLVTFSSKQEVAIRQELTPVHLNFEEGVEKLIAQSRTALFDGLDKARQMLCKLKEVHPQVKCRIIILTDGEDNSSTLQPSAVAQDMFHNDIVVDSIVIGTDVTRDLFKISKMTGGYAFAPKTQQALFQIFLLETVVDIRTRPDIVKESCPQEGWHMYIPKVADMSTPYDFPPCRPHPNQNDYFIALGDADRYLSRSQSTRGAHSVISMSSKTNSTTSRAMTGTTLSSGAGGMTRIILNEIKEMINHAHAYMDVYVSESNMGFWEIAMQGPPASAYSGGVFLLYLDIGPDFPLKPPSVRFITPMLHPNITKHGRICHPVFDREWSAATRVYQVLQHVWAILMSLEARDAVDPLSALKFWTDPTEGHREVEAYVRRFASKSRSVIRSDIIDSDTASSTSVISQGGDDNATTSSVRSNGSAKTTTIARREPSISTFLASQRGPPPLMSVAGQTQPATRTVFQSSDGDGVGENRSKRGSRRASFFGKFKK